MADRPKDWSNPYKDKRGFQAQEIAYEDGADAIQKAILRDFELKPKNGCDCFLCELDRV